MEVVIVLLILFGPSLYFAYRSSQRKKMIKKLEEELKGLQEYHAKANEKIELLETANADLQDNERQFIERLRLADAELQKLRPLMRYESITDVEAYMLSLQEKITEFKQTEIENQEKFKKLLQDRRNIEEQIKAFSVDFDVVAAGLYEPFYNFGTSELYKIELGKIRQKQEEMIRQGKATKADFSERLIDGDPKKTDELLDKSQKIQLRTFNAECDVAISELTWGNYDKTMAKLERIYNAVNKLGESTSTSIRGGYLQLKQAELELVYEYQKKLHVEREEQREIKERMREESKALREIEKALKDAAKEEEMLQKAMDRVRSQMETATEEQRVKYEDQIAELEQRWHEAEDRNKRALSMAQQTKAGHVYIISNVGSFGEDVYKIGMTRRLEPLDRIKELGDASVPFAFDVHALIWSDDAPSLENNLHKKFALQQINKVNYRKEFFKSPIAEIKTELDGMGVKAEWTMLAEAREYKETLEIERVIRDNPEAREAWLNRQYSLDVSVFAINESEDDNA